MSPLEGLRVVNTRSREHAGELNQLLRAAGAIPLPFPCISITPIAKIQEFDQMLRTQSFDWICLTSQHAAEMLVTRANAIELDRERLTAPRYAAVGAVTATLLKRHLNIDASFVPDTLDAESISRDCPIHAGTRVLMPVSNLDAEDPANVLRDKGVEVNRMVVYHTSVGNGGVDMSTLLKEGSIGAITFFSPSAVSGFVSRLKHEEGNLDHTRQVPIACIGPSTRNRAISQGMLRAFCSKEHTLPGLLDTLNDVVVSQRQGGRLWG